MIKTFRTHFLIAAALLFAILTLPSTTVVEAKESEGILNKLLAPGPLMEAHKDLERSECLQCHNAGKGVPDAQCLTCHKEIRAFVEEKRGYHGLRKETCIQCHSDHKGRAYDSTKVDRNKFKHEETGYKLEGKHAEISCEKCHIEMREQKAVRKNDTRFFGATSNCISCHKKDDVHFFKGPYAKKDCIACHGLKSWKDDIKFDHERDTKYKLNGKHAEMKCEECHVPKKTAASAIYKWPKLKTENCKACHEDYHRDNLGKKYQNGRCNICHSETTWKLASFDHAKTGYPLRGKHAEIKCEDCHKQRAVSGGVPAANTKNFRYSGLNKQCLACHKDEHLFGNNKLKGFKNLNNCLECHTEKSWQETHNFDHDTQTRYQIDGEHEKLKCSECHIPQRHMKPPRPVKVGIYHWSQLTTKTCENCHKSPHTKVFTPALLKKKCTECHITQGWSITSKNGFDHNKTRFALTGAHMKVTCNSCHLVNNKQVYKFANFEQKFCINCHTNVHKNQFHDKFSGESCTVCHSTKNFTERLAFDHNQTAYPLKDSHTKLKCEECHKPSNAAFAPNRDIKLADKNARRFMGQFIFRDLKTKDCSTCHSDYHQGQLGQKCSECHTEKGWKPTTFVHDKQSRYPLLGQHAEVKCEECHKPMAGKTVTFNKKTYPLVRYKPLPTNCAECHRDPHHGKFSNRCNDCHVEKDWKLTRDFHRNFTLYGVHYTLGCTECHIDNRRLSGLSQECITCHAKDDIHNGTLLKCGECHRQQFWENVEFKHSLSRFPLRGAHRTLDCVQCHANNVYRGAPNTCVACHLQDALNAQLPSPGAHAGFTDLNTCTDCHHNQFSFTQ